MVNIGRLYTRIRFPLLFTLSLGSGYFFYRNFYVSVIEERRLKERARQQEQNAQFLKLRAEARQEQEKRKAEAK
ncbi:Hypp3872 [Branchiostoma lanceolatum]|uniref:Hypp3872 protein n=1 Tax=Branchiostoma lanceolatum TaxID=7740 RepID=A0A8K0A352_BRALA|nr:Hypp3872 [Branchiostoma lanceolatum]